MASLQLVSDTYYICFRFAGRRFKRSLKTDRIDRADARRVRLEETLRLVETGRIEIPEDVVEFLLADGKPKRRKPLPPPVKTTPPPPFTLKAAFDEFFKAIPDGNLEQSTLSAMHIHERHLLKAIGSNFAMPKLGVETLQNYVNSRCRQKSRSGTLVSGRTIEKELSSRSRRSARTTQAPRPEQPRSGATLSSRGCVVVAAHGFGHSEPPLTIYLRPVRSCRRHDGTSDQGLRRARTLDCRCWLR